MSSTTSSSFISGLFDQIGNAATKLLTLAASADSSIHTFEAANPLVNQAISLAEAELGNFPIFAQAESVGNAVLGFAQMIASMTSAAASTAGAPSTVKASTPSTTGTLVG